MKKAYLAIKFHEDNKNKELIEDISNSLKEANIEVTVMVRDYEKWGKIQFSPNELMNLTFKLIKNSELVIIEFSEKGVGLGIEAGYAYANDIPIIVIAKEKSEISNTLKGIVKEIIYYIKPEDLTKRFKEIFIKN